MKLSRKKHVRGLTTYRIRGFALVVCCAVVGVANGTTVTLSQFPPNPGVMPGGGWQFSTGSTFANPTPPRAWVNGVYGAVPKFTATDIVTVAGRAGPLAVTAASTISMGEAALAVGRCLLGANAICAAASVAYTVYKAYRAVPSSSNPGEFDYDEGQGTVPVTGAHLSNGTEKGIDGNSADAVCNDQRNVLEAQLKEQYKDSTGTGPHPSSVSYTVQATVQLASALECKIKGKVTQTVSVWQDSPGAYETNSGVVLDNLFGYAVEEKTVPGCGVSIDAFNPANNVPAGSPVGMDGKCPTARGYHTTATAEAMAAKVEAVGPEKWPAELGTNWGAALKGAVDTAGIPVKADLQTSGPASQTGTPVVTSTTDATGTTTKTDTPTYNYNYAGNQVTYNTTNVIVTNNGTTTTTTTTTTGAAAPQSPDDPCTANPNRVGCMELGAPPTDEVPKTTKTLSYLAEDVGMPAACPDPVHITVSGHPQEVSYQPTCDAVVMAKPFILTAAAFASLLMVLAALRQM